ncbi:MAG TPA: trypsin-like peptidase domain-containing protein [Pirellulales bacterium]|jgi:serine protease Do
MLVVCAAQLSQISARADEPTGLAAAVALEDVLMAAIARGEKSVVSIARVADRVVPQGDVLPNFLGRPGAGGQQGPGDPEFVPTAFATGVVVGKGLVLTNHHALALDEKSHFYVTTSSRKTYAATVKAASPYSDLTVLELKESPADEEFVPITFGDGSKLRRGQIVIALGNPYAIARDGQASASWGIVANLQRKTAPAAGDNGTPSRPTLQHFGSLIQTDAKLNLGTSGGALLNLQGEMIGLTTSLAAVAGYEQAAGYAIPVDDAFRETVNKLKEGEERTHGLLGITFRRDEESSVAGVRVDRIYPAGPAVQADIRPNDVITRVNDQPIRDGDDLMLNIGRLPAGSPARITLERGGHVFQREVSLAKFPVQGKVVVTKPAPSWRGLTVDYATALLEYQARVNSGDAPLEPCVIVREVAYESPAWESGLRRGMLISHVGNVRVETPDEFEAAVAAKDDDLALRVVGGQGKLDTITVRATAAP